VKGRVIVLVGGDLANRNSRSGHLFAFCGNRSLRDG
jgi:hypothetical protein